MLGGGEGGEGVIGEDGGRGGEGVRGEEGRVCEERMGEEEGECVCISLGCLRFLGGI